MVEEKPNPYPIDVPALSSESRVEGIRPYDSLKGVVLGSIGEVRKAIECYVGNKWTLNDSERETLRQMSERSHEALALGLFGSINRHEGFLERLLTTVEENLRNRDRFTHHFEYEAMGTPLFKESLEVGKIVDGDTEGYLLELRRNEELVAQTLNRPRGIAGVGISAEISVVDDYWFNLDLKNFLRIPSIDAMYIGNLITWLRGDFSDCEESDRSEIEREYNRGGFGFEKIGETLILHGGEEFSLGIRFEHGTGITRRTTMPDKYLLRLREGRLVGPAFQYEGDYSQPYLKSVPRKPEIKIDLNLPQRSKLGRVTINPKKILGLRAIRDDLLSKIKSEF